MWNLQHSTVLINKWSGCRVLNNTCVQRRINGGCNLLLWSPIFQQGKMFSTREVKVVTSIVNKLSPVTEEWEGSKLSTKISNLLSYKTIPLIGQLQQQLHRMATTHPLGYIHLWANLSCRLFKWASIKPVCVQGNFMYMPAYKAINMKQYSNK